MTYSLVPHSIGHAKAIETIAVDVARVTDRLVDFRFAVTGRVADLKLCPIGPTTRQDGLWRTTCFEFFATLPTGYCEFNFGSSQAWAAYAFTDYRTGMSALEGVQPPDLNQDAGSGWFEFGGQFLLPALPTGFVPRVGISAVIEQTDGTKSYWALHHAPGPPDFHNPACFTATLPPPDRA